MGRRDVTSCFEGELAFKGVVIADVAKRFFDLAHSLKVGVTVEGVPPDIQNNQ